MSDTPATDMISVSSPALWARAGHDFRQPIQSLLLQLQVMADAGNASDRRQAARHMEDALVGLQAMLDALEQLARLEAGLDRPKLAPCCLSEVAARVAGGLAGLTAERNVSLRVEVPSVRVDSDARLLETVLTGLVLHALKLATGADIMFSYRRRSSAHRLEIAFKGPAITPAQQELAFIELRSPGGHWPVDRAAPGLGLIRNIAGVLGGGVECKTLSRHGQRLCLLLPAGDIAEVD